jgi:hypothetical protein
MKYVKPVVLFTVGLIAFGWAYNVGHNEFDPSLWDRVFHATDVEAQAGWLLGLRPGAAFGLTLMIVATLWVVVSRTWAAAKAAKVEDKTKVAKAASAEKAKA